MTQGRGGPTCTSLEMTMKDSGTRLVVPQKSTSEDDPLPGVIRQMLIALGEDPER